MSLRRFGRASSESGPILLPVYHRLVRDNLTHNLIDFDIRLQPEVSSLTYSFAL
jgi:hypothetical protein